MNDDVLAIVNVTYRGVNADLPNPVPYHASDENIKKWAAESIANGELRGLENHQLLDVDLSDLVVYRSENNRILLHQKTDFG